VGGFRYQIPVPRPDPSRSMRAPRECSSRSTTERHSQAHVWASGGFTRLLDGIERDYAHAVAELECVKAQTESA
jgi:hypothetical protein